MAFSRGVKKPGGRLSIPTPYILAHIIKGYVSDKGNVLPNPIFYILFKLRTQVDRYGSRFGHI